MMYRKFSWLYRVPWLVLLFVSATALSAYLCDPYSRPLSMGCCLTLHAMGWGGVIYAWLQYRRSLLWWNPACKTLFFAVRSIATLVLLTVTWEVCDTYFACPAPLEVRQYEALTAAVESRDLHAVQAILANDRQPDFTPPYSRGDGAFVSAPIEIAVGNGDVAIAAALIDHGAKIDSSYPDLLTDAAGKGNVAMLKLLLDRGAHINEGTKGDGDSPALWQAVECGQTGSVDLLLRHGANPRTKGCANGDQITVLQRARVWKNLRIVQLLKQAGATDSPP